MKSRDYAELISAALAGGRGWIPLGPLEAARRKPVRSYIRANEVAELEKEGLLQITPRKNGRIGSITLTEAGKKFVLNMPDDVGAEWFPLPRDIKLAKSKVKLSEINQESK